jgi:hypothetical protein
MYEVHNNALKPANPQAENYLGNGNQPRRARVRRSRHGIFPKE